MQPTRLCKAGILLGGAFLVSAWIFDDPAFFFAGGALWLFLLLSLHMTISAARIAADSLVGKRQTKERFSRSGTQIRMTTTLTCQVPPGYHLEAEEILPESATGITGVTRGIIPCDDGGCTLQYSFRLLAHGTIHPGGVVLRCSDKLFTVTVPVQKSSLQVPALFVFPKKGHAYEGSGGYGDRETMRRTPLKSSGVRSFREYRQGDNVKAIDWKMTARYGTPYVREYTGSEGGTAALVIDLPDDLGFVTEDEANILKKAVIQRIADIQERREQSLIIVLAGSEIVTVKEITPGGDMLHEISGLLAPKNRVHTMYRAYAPPMLAAQMRTAGRGMPLTPMAETAVTTFSGSADRTEFGETMHHVLLSSRDTELHCYTTGKGDLSHIWAMASAAFALHRPVKIYLPDAAVRDTIRAEAEFFNIRSLEVIQ